MTLDSIVKLHVTLWAVGTAGMIYLIHENPALQPNYYNRGNADNYYFTTGMAFWFFVALFFIANRSCYSVEKKSISNALMWVCVIPAITFSVLLPLRLTITFMDFNGRPVDVANHFEQLMVTPMLIYIMGEFTKARKTVHSVSFWNYPVFIAGFLASITTGVWSVFHAWVAVGCYSIFLSELESMFTQALEENSGSNMSKNAMWYAKIMAYTGNHVGILF